MPAARTYRARGRRAQSERTRARIMAAVRELLAEGTFHEVTVDEVAERAGIARATLYQHFRSRLDLVDAMCETFDQNPALLAIRKAADVTEMVALCVRFWSSEDAVLGQIYGVAAIDPAARDLVERQTADRRGEVERLVGRGEALAVLMVLTSYGTYRELRDLGQSDAKVTKTLQGMARRLLT